MGQKKEINEYHLNRHQPNKPQFAIHDLSEYQKSHQSDNTKPHTHSFYQIIWFTQGKGRHFVDFKAFDVTADSIFFISKNQVHYFDHANTYEGILIHFNEPFLVHNDSEMDFFLKCSIFNNPFEPPTSKINVVTRPILETYVEMIKSELQNKVDFGKEELVRGLLKAFLIQIHRMKDDSEKKDDYLKFGLNEKKTQLVKFVNLLDENYHKGLAVAEYAKIMLISSRTLADLTNQTINKTPSQMIQDRIILEAQRLLLHSNLNVNQIGYRLGFDDPSYFVKYFKKHSKRSPSEFRKSVS